MLMISPLSDVGVGEDLYPFCGLLFYIIYNVLWCKEALQF